MIMASSGDANNAFIAITRALIATSRMLNRLYDDRTLVETTRDEYTSELENIKRFLETVERYVVDHQACDDVDSYKE
jgi:hypothetical protein